MMSMVRDRDVMRTARREGRQEGQIETARKMKADGLEPALIMKYTDFSLAEIEAL